MDVSRARLETMNWRMEAVADLSSIQNNSSYKVMIEGVIADLSSIQNNSSYKIMIGGVSADLYYPVQLILQGSDGGC